MTPNQPVPTEIPRALRRDLSTAQELQTKGLVTVSGLFQHGGPSPHLPDEGGEAAWDPDRDPEWGSTARPPGEGTPACGPPGRLHLTSHARQLLNAEGPAGEGAGAGPAGASQPRGAGRLPRPPSAAPVPRIPHLGCSVTPKLYSLPLSAA